MSVSRSFDEAMLLYVVLQAGDVLLCCLADLEVESAGGRAYNFWGGGAHEGRREDI